MGDVFEDIIREFFANAIVEGDLINCWLRGREFYKEILEIWPTTPDISIIWWEKGET